jgi:hypothetical protein
MTERSNDKVSGLFSPSGIFLMSIANLENPHFQRNKKWRKRKECIFTLVLKIINLHDVRNMIELP